MGFKLPARTYKLVFEGALAGAEVTIRATPIGVAMAIRDADAPAMADLLAGHVVSWNLELEDGSPLPIDGDAIREHMEETVLARIVREWYKAAVGVTAPLDDESTSGETFQEASIPME